MNVAADRRWLRTLAIELGAYALLVGSFLGLYVGWFHEPADVIGRHLALIASLLAWPLALRALLWKLGGHNRLTRLCCALLMLLPAVLLATWYATVLVGLDSWGRAATWPLIRTYAAQAPHLLRALGVSPLGLAAAAAGALFLMAALVWRWLAPLDWTDRATRPGTRAGVSAILVALLLAASLGTYSLLQYGVVHPREPVALSFLPDASTRGLQSHLVGDSTVLGLREAAARQSYVAAGTQPQRNLVLIVGDALRADHMSIYGYARQTTPSLAVLMRERQGVAVSKVRSACAESACGLMALATSRSVAEIGPSPLTMQEILRRNGYGVHFILSGDHTNFYGLREMYGRVDSYHDGSQQQLRYLNDDELVLDAIESLPEATPGRPVALQFHLMSTHGLGSRDPALSPFQPWENYYRWPGPSPKRPSGPQAAQAAVNYYDNGMLRFDSIVARTLARLADKGYLANALVVITGDHGEMLGERGVFGHKHGVSEQVLGVPLLLLRYGYDGSPLAQPPWAGQIDIAPTILRELGVPAPDIWKGRALQDQWAPREFTVQQGRAFGVYRVGDDGRVLKYERDLDSGQEWVTDPVADPLRSGDLEAGLPSALLDSWRVQSMPTMLNSGAAH